MPAEPARIALLRGVNVGGTGRLPMAEFRALLDEIGLGPARTYLQSGNAVFRSAAAAAGIEARIAGAVAARFGFRPACFVLGLDALEAALAANPFPVPEPEEQTLHLFFLREDRAGGDAAPLAAGARRGERVAFGPGVLYLHAPEGIGRSELAQKVERLLGQPATARNLRSVRAIAALARALP